MDEITLTAENGISDRLDKYISENTELSRSYAAKLASDGLISVNGVSADKKYKLKGGERIVIEVPEPESLEAVPQNIPLDIVYEDDYIIVVTIVSSIVI